MTSGSVSLSVLRSMNSRLILGLKLAAAATLLFSAAAMRQAQTITINWNTALQPIDGFGAAAVDFSSAPSDREMDFFFTRAGIGLSVIRTQIEPDMRSCKSWIGAGGGTCVPSSGATLGTGELATVEAAVSRGALVIASPWSPPAVMKSNGSFTSGGDYVASAVNNRRLASDMASFVSLLTGSYGISVYALGVQNEPDISQTYPSCTWTAQQIHDYLPYLASALSAAGHGSTKIILPEESEWTFARAATAMSDLRMSSQIGIIAAHAYGSTRQWSTSLPNIASQHVWVSEYSSQSSKYDGGTTDALAYATLLDHYLTRSGISAWIHWELSDESCCGNGTDNSALTDKSGNIPKRTYVLGNWSKFVRPGWHMVSVTNNTPLLVTAFENSPRTECAMVLINSSSLPVDASFSVGTLWGAFTPWITSSTHNLTAMPILMPTAGHLSYAIPPDSVVTLYGVTRPRGEHQR